MNQKKSRKAQLEEMLSLCRALGADVRYRPEQEHFTAMCWEGWDTFFQEEKAQLLQQKMKERIAQYPNLMCYCFDPFSTLIYAI